MATWQLIGRAIAAPAAIYGLHRLAPWLEDHGHLYYLGKKSTGGAAGGFVALQRAIEPQSQHVEQVRHVEHRVEDDEAAGSGQADPSG